jgi:uncharacterized protein YciI
MTELRQFLYKLCPTRLDMVRIEPTDSEASILTQHFSYLKGLTDQGTVLLAGRTQNRDESTFGIVILQTDTEHSAKGIMQDDPAVKHGIMRAELYSFKVALHGDAWGSAT